VTAPTDAEPASFPPGAQVEVRDEVWLVRKVTTTRRDGAMLEVTGVSPFVRNVDAVFYTSLDTITPLDPRKTLLVPDDSPHHRRARLYLEAVVRKSFLPQTENGLALADTFLADYQVHQVRPAQLALSMRNPQPRLLIADVVGLGKTLEIGILLAELIRRGRGERILVVTPAPVLEQFQRELWTRFGIPLVRLDSTGIQRVQREIPLGRNPFAYFKRVIVSVDTLKSKDYSHHLEHTDWDAVVIDESHNLINRGSDRNELAQKLAPRTDALVLASATPHNGDGRSFAELIRLLDPAAIADPAHYDVKDLDHLYIRRSKTTPEVRDALRGAWADRGPSLPIQAPATPAEEAVFEALASEWLPADGTRSVSAAHLFPYTLFKSFLSSHKALIETINKRRENLGERADGQAERTALDHLKQVAKRIDDTDSAKLAALVAELRALGVGPGSDTRVVVFSERTATLNWLAEVVPAQLGFPSGRSDDPKRPWLAYQGAVEVMHGDVTDDEQQMKIVERFGLRDARVRILFTGDVASEGVNLHQQCHLLIHYDLPWSLIRIEQRNGRIDRYGQAYPPQFRALILTSAVRWRSRSAQQFVPGVAETDGLELRPFDDRLVGEILLAREAEAHRIEGSADAVSGLYRPQDEEDRLTRDLIAGRTVPESLVASAQTAGGILAGLLGQVGTGAPGGGTEVPRAVVPALFGHTGDYVDAAFRQVFHDDPEGALSLRYDEDGTIAFSPPPDLVYRLRALPASYLSEQRILGTADEPGRMRVTFSEKLAKRRMDAARESSDSMWPSVSYLTDIHPVLDWLTDKVLVEFGRHEAPVLGAAVPTPTFLVQGIYSNALGRPTVVEWMAVAGLPQAPRVTPMTEALAAAGVGASMPGRRTPIDLPGLQALVPLAIDAAADYLTQRRAAYDAEIEESLAPYRRRLEAWWQSAPVGARRSRNAEAVSRRDDLVRGLETVGAPMLRLLAVLEGDVPHQRDGGGAS
jgi:superfamily II DNA or RNA helicase